LENVQIAYITTAWTTLRRMVVILPSATCACVLTAERIIMERVVVVLILSYTHVLSPTQPVNINFVRRG
jgi:hypothetical protein